METKKIALMDKYGKTFTEGPNFNFYVEYLLDKKCSVYQLDPYTIDFEKKVGKSYNLSCKDKSILRGDPLEFELESFDAILDMSDIVNLKFAKKLQAVNTFHFNPPIPTYYSADKKTYVKNYPELIPQTFITKDISKLENLMKDQFDGIMVVKNPSGAHGDDIFKVTPKEDYLKIFKEITKNGGVEVIAQKYLHYCLEGGQRVILLGEPNKKDSFEFVISYRKIPGKGQWKDNLALGSTTVLTDLREDEKELCLEVASNSGLYGVGLDIMDDKSESGERVSRLIETNAIIATRAHPKAMHRTIDFILERLS